MCRPIQGKNKVPILAFMMSEFIEKIGDKSLRMSALGSGYVGLPTATLFADAGFSVLAVDVRPELVSAVNDGLSPVSEPGLAELISRNVKAGRLRASLNSGAELDEFDTIIISVQTRMSRDRISERHFLECPR